MSGQGRRTLARRVDVRGTALHGGQAAALAFCPAPSGSGIVFRRTDHAAPPIPALAEHVTATTRRTVLGGVHGVDTVEHVLGAVYAAGLDDVAIQIDGREPPGMDGSARPFLEALRAGGVAVQTGAPTTLRLRPLELHEGPAHYTVHPSLRPRLAVSIDFAHPLIGVQHGSWPLTPDGVAEELAGARTFGFVREAAALAAQGLGQGATTNSALILTADGLAGGTLRWADEFVRHKALDLVGDLMLAGSMPAADITAVRPSHAGNVALARALRS